MTVTENDVSGPERLTLSALIEAASRASAAGGAARAHRLYKDWIAANPGHPQLCVALFNGAALDRQFDGAAAAVASLEKAIALNPDFVPAYVNLGRLYEEGGAPGRAVELWRAGAGRAQAINGYAIDYAVTALTQAARVLTQGHDSEAAEAVMRQCLDIRPGQPEVLEQFTAARLAQCKWPVIAPTDRLSRATLMGGINPLSMAAYTDDPLLQLAAAYRYVKRAAWDGPHDGKNDRRHAPIDLSGRRLRIGYVSSDLRDHAIGYLMAELFELHDRGRVEVFAYYCGPESNSALTNRIKAAVEHWCDISPMNDGEAAARIAADGIDILVDVNGHTRDARTGVFARRPAPVQVNWLGYPGSMGSPYHHYIIADDWIIPPEMEIYYAEKVVRLPCYQANDRKRIVADTRPGRAEAGLPEDAFVFCCFNGTHKISRFTFERWMDILARAPHGVLWLLDTAENTKTHLREMAERRGVAGSRLVFAPKLANPLHLARYPLADLFLDCTPYGAHTTASDALWMGVPVLTLSGRGFASRVCGSLVRSAGLPELVTTRAEDYVERAVALAHDRARVENFKARLKTGRDTCTLFDMDLLTRKLEDLYRGLADAHRRGETPRPDLANLDCYFEAGLAHDHDAEEMFRIPDYHGFYKARLKQRHLARPLSADTRLWREGDIAAADAPPGAVPGKVDAGFPSGTAANQKDMATLQFNEPKEHARPSAGTLAMRLLESRMLRAEGRILECLAALLELKGLVPDKNTLLDDVRAIIDPTVERFNECAAAGDIEQAARYADALAALLPRNAAALGSALSCARALGRREQADAYAATLAGLSAPPEEPAPGTHPLLQLRDLYDEASRLLCGPLTDADAAEVGRLIAAGRALEVPVPPDSQWAAWEKHYRLALEAADLTATLAPTPDAAPEPKLTFADASGRPLTWRQVQAIAKAQGAQVLFFAAADRAYVDLYARAYIGSILAHADMPALILLHVIGGAGNLAEVAEQVGIASDRLVYAGDAFDAAAVRTSCHDAPPKGRSEKPLAHLQSVRFQRLGRLLRGLKRPVFVSDIDLILQRGVDDLLRNFSGHDIVLNQNLSSDNAGARYTANLVLVNPTPNAGLFMRFMHGYLEKALSGPEVTRWIDQFALLQARHHLLRHAPGARIGFFDDSRDINNVMYTSYRKHPFRFLSLYHGFDMASLPGQIASGQTAGAQDAPPQSRPKAMARRSGRA